MSREDDERDEYERQSYEEAQAEHARAEQEMADAREVHDRNAARLTTLGYVRVERPEFPKPDRWEHPTDSGGFSIADETLFNEKLFSDIFGTYIHDSL